MGGNSSLLEQPWRDVSTRYKENLQFVKSYKPRNQQVQHLRILLHGPIGAGKSSFVNSVDTILQNRIAGRAQTDSFAGSSFTKQYKTFKFHKEQDSTYSFLFTDIMGLEKDSDRGVPVGDIKLALRGHMEEGYEFNSNRGLKEGDLGYNSHPTVEDRVHVLVCVVPASSVPTLDDEIVAKIREVRLAASDLGIPQMAILTKVDQACPEAAKDSSNIYKSKYLKELVERFHMLLGIPLNCIFLMKNYNEELQLNERMNETIMCALRQMVVFGQDYLNDL